MNSVPRSRRLALVASCAILGLGLAACGSAEDAGAPSSAPAASTSAAPSDDRPPVIVLQSPLGGARAESAAASPMDADSAFAEGEPGTKMAVADLDYEYAGTPPELGTEGTAWRFPAGGVATAEQAAMLAAALGVSGDPVQLPADQGGGWLVGPADYTAATVNLSSDAMQSWWYSAGPSQAEPMCGDVIASDSGETVATQVAPDGGTAEPAVSEPAASAEVPVTAGESKPEPAVIEPGAPVPCAEVEPPANLPDEATATASATALLQALGLDPASYEIEVNSDEWATSVSASLVLDGVRSNVTTYVAYGEDGQVMWAGGALATPERADVYPLIGVAGGIDRLNEQADSWYGDGVTVGRAAAEPAAASVDPASETVPVGEPTAGETVPGDTPVVGTAGSSEPGEAAPSDTMSIQPVPEEIVGETLVIMLTGARPSLEQQWSADGTVWLLPGYQFDSDDGGWYSVVAIEDEYLQQVMPDDVGVAEPGLEPEPLPTAAPEAADEAKLETPATDAAMDE